ncbi:LysR family transcriptional regulator [Sphingobium sp. BHU LFT2]|uniref:LysR family transcriptional regulator n=1 Tax=Sphingobium sp. BHU LFT2 TaxID=2807634 RepID=UPI001BE948F4|nr:LysR family transcriptional regulator [Sphingobium sp. BHU LFT2]MBT2246274.1 LysR family transcriptional regulator [Sphingobium sp. BHU LFT2]
MDLRYVAVFVEAAHAGSLAAAARRLGIPPMVASRRLASLETDVGARLMHRTTVASALTPEGEEFLPFAQAMLENEGDARRALAPSSANITGLLRVTASAAFSRKMIVPALPQMMQRNPALRIELTISDTLLDIVGLGIDLAIRIAPLRDSNLIARKLADNPRALYATPAYLAHHGTPVSMADLQEHQCLTFPQITHWTFAGRDKPMRARVSGAFTASSMEGLHAACLADLGIALLSPWDVREELAAGRLKRIELNDGKPEPLAIWAVYPTTRLIPPKVRMFLTELQKVL